MKDIKRNIVYKIFVYNIIRMEEEEEEEETFWYHCARLVKAIRLYHEDGLICNMFNKSCNMFNTSLDVNNLKSILNN